MASEDKLIAILAAMFFTLAAIDIAASEYGESAYFKAAGSNAEAIKECKK